MVDRRVRLASESRSEGTSQGVRHDGGGRTEPALATYSSITTHRKCPQMWKYRYVDRLGRDGETAAPALEFGSWFHAVRAAERLTKGRTEGTLLAEPPTITTVDGGPEFPADDAVPDDVLDAAADWYARLGADKHSQWESWLGQALPDRLAGAFTGWRNRWADEARNEAVLAVEHRWERPLPMPKGYDGPPVSLFGYIDEVYRDRRRGITVIRDCKTSKSIDRVSAMDELMDSQVQLYAWGLIPQCGQWGVPSPRAVSFDRVRATAPKTPSLTKSGRLSKSVTDYDLETYLEWVGDGVPFEGLKKDGSGAGVYKVEEAEVARLSSDGARRMWFRRSLTPLSVGVVRMHLRAAVDSVEDIARTRVRVERAGEASRNLVGVVCKWCDFAELCRAQAVGGVGGGFDPAEYGLVVRGGRGR